MGLEKVKQEILEKAHAEANDIISSANAEARSIVREAEKKAQQEEEDLLDESEKANETMKKKTLAAALLELQKQSLELKNELVERVFSESLQKISQLPDKRRESHIKALIEAAKREMAVALIQCNPRDARFIEGKIVKNSQMTGGIIAESQDGKLRIDFSYETLLEQTRSKVLSDVAKKLFKK